jgi:DNA-binding protein HU-beta
MTKEQIVDSISRKTGISKSACKEIVESFMERVSDSLTHGEKVTIRGFGSFVLKKRAIRHFHAPSGKLFIIPEHEEPFFKPCKEFKDMIK